MVATFSYSYGNLYGQLLADMAIDTMVYCIYWTRSKWTYYCIYWTRSKWTLLLLNSEEGIINPFVPNAPFL